MLYVSLHTESFILIPDRTSETINSRGIKEGKKRRSIFLVSIAKSMIKNCNDGVLCSIASRFQTLRKLNLCILCLNLLIILLYMAHAIELSLTLRLKFHISISDSCWSFFPRILLGVVELWRENHNCIIFCNTAAQLLPGIYFVYDILI